MGSSCTILRKEIFEHIPVSLRPVIEPVNMTLLTATGETAPFYGKVVLKLKIGQKIFEHEILLANDRNDGILGIDLLEKYSCDVNLRKRKLRVQGESILCYLKDSDQTANSCYRIAVCENVTVLPGSGIMIEGKLLGSINSQLGLVETNSKFCEKSGLLVAKALVDSNNEIVPLRVVNFNNQPYTVNKNTVAANYESVTLSNLYRAETVCSLEYAYSDEMPEHIKNVYDNAIKSSTTKQPETLKTFLLRHQMFSLDLLVILGEHI